MGISVVYLTASSSEEAQKIGRDLVQNRLAACVNISGEIQSIYWWESKLEESRETSLIAKTKTERVPELIERVKEIHSYDCPCIVSWQLDQINPDYEQWLEKELELREE